MLNVHAIKPEDLKALSGDELAATAAQMLAHIVEQSRHIGEQSKRIDTQAQAIKWRDAKIQSITFQLARLKAWKFGAKTERMNAEQRDIFEETLAADQASLEAQLAALQDGASTSRTPPEKQQRRQPKREPLPAHLPRVGEDISERLDIIPAQFFVQRQIRGKWASPRVRIVVAPIEPRTWGRR